jgi:hypothetical protein
MTTSSPIARGLSGEKNAASPIASSPAKTGATHTAPGSAADNADPTKSVMMEKNSTTATRLPNALE